MQPELSAIQAYWNERAKLGVTAGTQDLILKELEQRAILAEVRAFHGDTIGSHRVLEVGCGHGELARLLLEAIPGLNILAIDNARNMMGSVPSGISTAWSSLLFDYGDALSLPEWRCHLAITERLLINLPTWEQQKQAIDNIAAQLFSGGWYLMCEHSQRGLNDLNYMRLRLGLSEIQPPWHNRYLRDEELQQITSLKLLTCIPFSATYYFLSRIVNAYMAKQEGKEPAYDAPINQLALTLWPPPEGMGGRYAQARLWVWSKE